MWQTNFFRRLAWVSISIINPVFRIAVSCKSLPQSETRQDISLPENELSSSSTEVYQNS